MFIPFTVFGDTPCIKSSLLLGRYLSVEEQTLNVENLLLYMKIYVHIRAGKAHS